MCLPAAKSRNLAAGCIALIDTGTFDLILPAEVVASIIQLLGLPANPALVGADITGRTLVQAQVG